MLGRAVEAEQPRPPILNPQERRDRGQDRPVIGQRLPSLTDDDLTALHEGMSAAEDQLGLHGQAVEALGLQADDVGRRLPDDVAEGLLIDSVRPLRRHAA